MKKHLCTVEETTALIYEGKRLMLAGTSELLSALPKGSWIGGSIPYFMDTEGGVFDSQHIFVTELPETATHCEFVKYSDKTISRIVADGPRNSLTFLILPAFSSVHETYAKGAPDFPEMYMRPIVGWVSGVAVEEIGKVAPKAFMGPTGEWGSDFGVAAHVTLPSGTHAKVDILNVFCQGEGPVLEFDETTFEVRDCLIDGVRRNLAEYLATHETDTKLPLVADYCGAMINTSFASVDAAMGVTRFYAPVFPNIPYRVAHEIENFEDQLQREAPALEEPAFACNCILNYLYQGLEGKRLGNLTGPITFGEIAYQLLNQTLVYVELEAA